MVVDLDRSRSVSTYVYQDFMKCHIPTGLAGCLNTLPVPISRKDCPFKARFVFAYEVDNSDKPSHLLRPNRGVNGQFLLVDSWSGNYFDLDCKVHGANWIRTFLLMPLPSTRNGRLKVDAAAALNIIFFLCCCIALDSCGQIVARSQKEIENQLTYGKQQETTQPTQTNQGKGELK